MPPRLEPSDRAATAAPTQRDRRPTGSTPARRLVLRRRQADWLRASIGQAVLLWILPWPMMLVGRLGSVRARHAVEQVWARSAARVLRLRIELRGLHLVDPSRRYLVLPLHEGLADPLVLFRLPMPLRFVARDELRSWPVVGAYLRMTGQLMAVDGNRMPARALLRQARHAVRGGESIVVFPQSSVLGIEVGFRPGALRLAQTLGLPVLPVAISGTHRVWEHPFSPRLRFGQRVMATILPPVEVAGLDRRQLAATMLDLERTMKEIARRRFGNAAAPRTPGLTPRGHDR